MLRPAPKVLRISIGSESNRRDTSTGSVSIPVPYPSLLFASGFTVRLDLNHFFVRKRCHARYLLERSIKVRNAGISDHLSDVDHFTMFFLQYSLCFTDAKCIDVFREVEPR